MPYLKSLYICAFICFLGIGTSSAQPNQDIATKNKELYQVQIATYEKLYPHTYFKKAGLDKVKFHRDDNSFYRYYLGFFDDKATAEKNKEIAIEHGFPNAKVIITDESEIDELNKRKYYEVTYDELFLRTVHFDMNSAKLDAPDQQLIHEVYSILVRNPDWVVQLSGHSDSVGSPEYNVKISKDRVRSVKYRLEQYGIQTRRIKTRVFGEAAPIAKNREKTGEDVPAGRQLNRRVCIGIYNENGEMVNVKDSTIVPFDVELGN